MKLSVIIPLFNEEKTIKNILEKVKEVKLPKGIEKEVIVVDDGSTDNSVSMVQSLKLKDVKLISHKKNMGKGAGVRTGLDAASGDLVIIQDADLEYDPSDFGKLITPIIEGKAKVVYGTRLVDYPFRLWGKDKTPMPIHYISNKMLTALTNILYSSNLTDMETCYKIFKKDIFKKIQLKSNQFDFEPEITAKILKLKIPIVEIPIKVKPRTYSEGKKIGWIDGFMAIWTLLKYRFID